MGSDCVQFLLGCRPYALYPKSDCIVALSEVIFFFSLRPNFSLDACVHLPLTVVRAEFMFPKAIFGSVFIKCSRILWVLYKSKILCFRAGEERFHRRHATGEKAYRNFFFFQSDLFQKSLDFIPSCGHDPLVMRVGPLISMSRGHQNFKSIIENVLPIIFPCFNQTHCTTRGVSFTKRGVSKAAASNRK